jgi:outer membrane protein OmpA-like peptidoglycan-associated protein
MDLWRSEFRDGGWTVPENLGPKVNSPYNEILATISGDTLYYSSDRPYTGYGGYDIYGYHFSESRNWNLGIPLNGPYDEHSFHVLDPGRGMLVSNRFGEFSGGMLYTTTWSVKEDFFDEISGHISGSGDLSGEEVVMLNQEGAVIQRGVINTDGSFVFRHVKGMETYTIQLADKKLDLGANLKVFDGEGKLLQEVNSSGKQGFKFVLLSPIEYIMERVDNEDQSILSVSIFGKLDENEPKVQGLTIVLLDGEGTEVAKTKTGADGLFKFESVAADEKYHIVSEVKDAGKPIHILDAHGNLLQTILPDEEGEYAYVRIKPEDGVITLSNEYNKRVRISDKDLFNLGAVQYELNSYTIAKESAGVLDKLAAILNANPEIALHLSGHTDSRGADDFNLKLSQKRLNSAIAYLKYKGVDPSRLSGIGYGETKLLNHCDDGTDCSEEEHAVNRRTEFRLKEIGK